MRFYNDDNDEIGDNDDIDKKNIMNIILETIFLISRLPSHIQFGKYFHFMRHLKVPNMERFEIASCIIILVK